MKLKNFKSLDEDGVGGKREVDGEESFEVARKGKQKWEE